MPRPLSNGLRERIVRGVDGCRGIRRPEAGCQRQPLVKLIQQWKTTGSYLAKRVGGQRKHLWAGHEDKVNRLLSEKPEITVTEMQARLLAVRIKVSQSAITRFFIHLGHSKKNGSRQRTRSA